MPLDGPVANATGLAGISQREEREMALKIWRALRGGCVFCGADLSGGSCTNSNCAASPSYKPNK